MKKIILILVLLLTACAPAFPMLANSTAAPAVCDCATPTASVTPSPGPTVAPWWVGFDAYDGTIQPPTGLYQVAALAGPDLWNYTYAKQPNAWFPATFMLGYNTSPKAFNLNVSYCPLSTVGALMEKLNTPQEENYGTNSSDGVNFGDHGIANIIFPSTIDQPNLVMITSTSFLKPVGGLPEWFGIVKELPCTPAALAPYVKAPSTLPAYEVECQSDMTHNGALLSSMALNGFPFCIILASNYTMYVPFRMLIPDSWNPEP